MERLEKLTNKAELISMFSLVILIMEWALLLDKHIYLDLSGRRKQGGRCSV
jgi:hypothetical protein